MDEHYYLFARHCETTQNYGESFWLRDIQAEAWKKNSNHFEQKKSFERGTIPIGMHILNDEFDFEFHPLYFVFCAIV